MTRQFVTRRRRDSNLGDGLHHGWDEVIDGRETGRIVLGWTFDAAGALQVRYAPEGYEPKILQAAAAPLIEDAGRDAPADRGTIPDYLRPGAPLVVSGETVPPLRSDAVTAVLPPPVGHPEAAPLAPSLSDLQPSFGDRQYHQPGEDRYFVEFEWRAETFDYGTERYPIASPQAAQAARQRLEDHFRAYRFANWRIIHETVRSESLGWPIEGAAGSSGR